MTELSWQGIAIVAGGLSALGVGVLGYSAQSKKHNLTTYWVLLCLLCLLTVIAQVIATVQHHRYNGDFVLRLEEKFDSKKQERAEGASAIYTYLKKGAWDAVSDKDIDSLDDILGFFDELGFYLKHGQVSDIVLHEYFYDAARIYCQETRGYVEDQRRTMSASSFENIEFLLDKLTQVEAKKTGRVPTDCKWDRDTLEESLKPEMRLNRKPVR